MTDPPLISALIPTHNRARLLEGALESIAEQEYRPLEVVVVDDGSTDETTRVIEQAAVRFAERGITMRSTRLETKSGPAAARNAGLAITEGSIIAFLDSDDLWLPTFVSSLAELLQRYPNCGVAFSGITTIDADGEVTGIRDQGLPGNDPDGYLSKPIDQLAIRFPFVTLATMVRRSVLDDVGPFDEGLAIWSDADVWYRIASRYDFAYTRTPLTLHRTHPGNITTGRLHGGVKWLYYTLLVNMRHLEHVQSDEARKVLVGKIQQGQILLQEEMLREGRRDAEFRSLLERKVGSESARYRFGQWMLDSPEWLSRGYVTAIRQLGNMRRRLQRAGSS